MKLVIASSDLVSGIKHAAHEVGRSKDGTLYMTVENGAKPTITFYGNGTKSEAEATLPLFSLDPKGMTDGVMRVALDAEKTLALAGLISRADYTTITYTGAASAVPRLEQDSGLKVRMAVHAAAMGDSPISARAKTRLKADKLTAPAPAAVVSSLLSATDAVAYADGSGKRKAALLVGGGKLLCVGWGGNGLAMYSSSVDVETADTDSLSFTWAERPALACPSEGEVVLLGRKSHLSDSSLEAFGYTDGRYSAIFNAGDDFDALANGAIAKMMSTWRDSQVDVCDMPRLRALTGALVTIRRADELSAGTDSANDMRVVFDGPSGSMTVTGRSGDDSSYSAGAVDEKGTRVLSGDVVARFAVRSNPSSFDRIAAVADGAGDAGVRVRAYKGGNTAVLLLYPLSTVADGEEKRIVEGDPIVHMVQDFVIE